MNAPISESEISVQNQQKTFKNCNMVNNCPFAQENKSNNFIYNPRLPATIDETSVDKSRQQFSRCEPAADIEYKN